MPKSIVATLNSGVACASTVVLMFCENAPLATDSLVPVTLIVPLFTPGDAVERFSVC